MRQDHLPAWPDRQHGRKVDRDRSWFEVDRPDDPVTVVRAIQLNLPLINLRKWIKIMDVGEREGSSAMLINGQPIFRPSIWDYTHVRKLYSAFVRGSLSQFQRPEVQAK